MMTAHPFAAIVLAAGRSTRMGQFKPLLRIAGSPLVALAIDLFRQNQVRDIIVVTGHRAHALIPVLAKESVQIAHNTRYEKGMFSSVVRGIQALPNHCEAFFVLPVDLALVQPASVGRLMEAYGQKPGHIYHPTVEGRRGHPPLIPARYAGRIANHTGQGGLRQALKPWTDQTAVVAVADRHILFDLDTPEDLLKHGRPGV